MKTGSISVVIPVHNGAEFLAEAIRSVLSQEAQPREILVVDDGSTDESAEVARGFAPEVRVLQRANAGPSAARNLGVQTAQGDYLAFLDHDDLMVEGRLSLQAGILDADPAIDLVFGRQMRFLRGEDPWQLLRTDSSAPRSGSALVGCAMCCRRSVFDRVGLFRIEREFDEFPHWLVRATACGLVHSTPPQIVICRRIHGNNLSQIHGKREYVHLVKAIIDDRRAQQTKRRSA